LVTTRRDHDHKQKVLPKHFRECQSAYFAKAGMSMLGCMITYHANDKQGNGHYYYKFVDFIIDGYKQQDNIQIEAILLQLKHHITQHFPHVTEIILQSDNASGFASQQHIPQVHHMNADSLPVFSTWIFTEAQTGKSRLDTHFSYVNLQLTKYINAGHDILTESDIQAAMSFQDGIAGTTSILLDASRLLLVRADNENNTKYNATTGCRSTHEIRWSQTETNIYQLSGITLPETICSSTYSNFPLLDRTTHICKAFSSNTMPLHIPTNQLKDIKPTNITRKASPTTTHKTMLYHNALNEYGTATHEKQYNDTHRTFSTTTEAMPVPLKWAIQHSIPRYTMPHECVIKLISLYKAGQLPGACKCSPEKAHHILITEIIPHDWNARFKVTIAKIKTFFGMTPAEHNKLLHKINDATFNEQLAELLEQHEQELLEEEMDESLYDLNYHNL
jgi:hypothetical protein